MKNLHLSITTFAILLLVPVMMNSPAKAGCMPNSDWPHAPCYAIPGLNVTKEQMKKDWAGYYLYKGPQWMEVKRTEMVNATAAGILKAWACKSTSNDNVWQYYYLNDQAPSIALPMNGPMCDIPPLQQLKVGTQIGDIQCGYDLYLLVNKESDAPACVKLTSIPRLLDFGWQYLATYLNNTEPHSTTVTSISIAEQDLPNCKLCEGKSENVTVVVGTNNTVRWINSTPSPILFLTLPNDDDIAFYNSATFPLGGHIGAMKFPAYLYGGQDFEFTFTKPGKFFWHTNPQFMGWVTVLPQNTTESEYHDFPNAPQYSIVNATFGIPVENDTMATKMAGFNVSSPSYLPLGYQVKLIKVSKELPLVTIFASKHPITNRTTSSEFFYNDTGILITYALASEREIRNYQMMWSSTPPSNKITLDGFQTVFDGIRKGNHDGYLYDQWADLVLYKGNTIIGVRGFLPINDLVKITVSMLENQK